MPNPTAVVLLVVALVVVIVAYKGTQANFLAAILGHAPSGTGTSSSSSSSASNSSPSASHGGISPGDILPWVGGLLPGAVSLLSTPPTYAPAPGAPVQGRVFA